LSKKEWIVTDFATFVIKYGQKSQDILLEISKLA